MFPLARSCRSPDRPRLKWLLGCVGLLVVQASALQAASARDELLRFVPENTGVCLVFQDLRTHWATLLGSPFAEQMRRSPLVEALRATDEFKRLNKLEKAVLQPLGLDWSRVRDDILGEAVVFAFRPGPGGKSEQDQALLLIRAQNAATLADLVERFNESQKKSGMLKGLEEREHNGVKYFRREDLKEASYYHLRGPILLLTSQEAMLQQALDCDRTLPASAEPVLAGRLRQLGADRTLLTWFLNPRVFKEAVEARARGEGPEAAIHRTVAEYWKALDGLAVSLVLDRDVSLRLAVQGRLEQLPVSARRFLTQAARPSDLWRSFPDNALLAVAGRCDAAALLEVLGDFMSPKSRAALRDGLNATLGAALDTDFVRDVLPFLGPDFGFCVLAPQGRDKDWMPQSLFALRVSKGTRNEAPVDRVLLSAVQSLVQSISFFHNLNNPDKPLTLKSTVLDNREIKYLAGDKVFPPGTQPAFALHNGYLLLASSPEVIRRFGTVAILPDESGAFPLLRLSLKDWRNYLKERREELLRTMTARNQLPPQEAAERLDRLATGLQFLDRLEIRQQTSPNQVVLTFTIQPSLPLKK